MSLIDDQTAKVTVWIIYPLYTLVSIVCGYGNTLLVRFALKKLENHLNVNVLDDDPFFAEVT